MSTHTPGPWAVHSQWRGVVVPSGHERKSLGASIDPNVEAERYAKVIHRIEPSEHLEFYRSRIVSGAEAEANARLIAAAPSLLQALKDILAGFSICEPNCNCIIQDAKAAIAKAEGQP